MSARSIAGSVEAVKGDRPRRSPTARSACWSARRAAASPRCCAWSRGSRRSPRGDGRHRRPRRQRGRAGRPRHRHGVPELRALSAHERLRQHGLWPAQPRHAQGRDRRARAGGRAHPRDRAACSTASRGSSPAASASASPWAAPSCASRRCSCSTSRCPISTPSCACRCASRSASCSAALGATVDLRHPRPGRGDDARRHARRDERRPRRADRHAARGLSAARRRPSSPPSSARRR